MELLDYVFVDNENYRPAITADKLDPPSPSKWELVLCQADGNCFYHALSKSTNKNKNALRIRYDLLKYIEKNYCTVANIDTIARRIFSGIESALRNESISADAWANHEEIQMCARMYNIVICIWNADFKMWTACFPKDHQLLLSHCRKAVFLYSDGVHFNLLRRKKPSSIFKK